MWIVRTTHILRGSGMTKSCTVSRAEQVTVIDTDQLRISDETSPHSNPPTERSASSALILQHHSVFVLTYSKHAKPRNTVHTHRIEPEQPHRRQHRLCRPRTQRPRRLPLHARPQRHASAPLHRDGHAVEQVGADRIRIRPRTVRACRMMYLSRSSCCQPTHSLDRERQMHRLQFRRHPPILSLLLLRLPLCQTARPQLGVKQVAVRQCVCHSHIAQEILVAEVDK